MPKPKSKQNFWKIFLTLVVLFVIVIGLGIYKASTPDVSISDKSIIKLNLTGPLPEADMSQGFGSYFSPGPLSLQSLRHTLVQARTDERIQGVLLNIGPLMEGFGKLQELRSELLAFRKSGKPLWAYISYAGDKEYYLASAATKIYMEPYSALFLDGLTAELLYLKKPLEKLGIQFQASAQGKYKSAIETFVNEEPSRFDLEQRNALLDDLFSEYVTSISQSRSLSKDQYTTILNSELLIGDDRALELGLIDSIAYLNDLKKKLKRTYADPDEEEQIFITPQAYQQAQQKGFGISDDNEIALITIQGNLIDTERDFRDQDGFSTNRVIAGIERAAKNEQVKAIVLRIDSPGGSGIASDKILSALDSAKVKKPIVASMSGVAASGGYWVALNANRIIANPLTVTGSIGVFSLRPYLKKLKENIGLKRVVLERGRFSDAFNSFEKLSPEAEKKFNAYLGNFYRVFKEKVALHRQMPIDSVEQVAQGRVWTGMRAKEIGLVDELGGLSKALEIAKKLSDIAPEDTFKVVSYPKKRGLFEQLRSGEFFNQALNWPLIAIGEFMTQSELNLIKTPFFNTQSMEQIEQSRGVLEESMRLKPITWHPYYYQVK
jgi:protease-4